MNCSAGGWWVKWDFSAARNSLEVGQALLELGEAD